MKRTTEILAAAAVTSIMAASCTESYPGLDYVPDPNHVIKNTEDLSRANTPILLFATEQDFFIVGTRSGDETTRGTGTFEDVRLNKPKYLNSTFHVFAFRAGTGADGSGGQNELTDAPDLTLSAYSPSKDEANDTKNTSCLLDGQSYYTGARFGFSKDLSGSFESRETVPLYYSAEHQAVGYNFFVYHIDDFQPTAANTHRTASSIWYDFEVDGARDVMYGSAPKLTESYLDETYPKLNLTDKEKANIMKGQGGYSTYSGHRHVDPIVALDHKLCRLKFFAYPGDSSANRTTIDSISVMSKYSGKFTVAGRTPDAMSITWDEDKMRELFLSEASEDSIQSYPGRLREGGYVMKWLDEYRALQLTERPVTQIGSSLMLPPADNFVLYIYSTFTTADGKKVNYRSRYNIFPPQATRRDGTTTNIFDEGIVYNIRIAVYGLQQIQINVSDNGWQDGGTIVVDPDEAVYE